jgi:hypothetical protein
MEDYPILFTIVVLITDVDAASLIGKVVKVEIDQSYTIGRSIAVLHDDTVIGHLSVRATPNVWRHLRANTEELHADIYEGTEDGWRNEPWCNMMTGRFELGIRIRVCYQSRDDGKLFLAHLTTNKLNTFPGLTHCDCPKSLKPLAFPVKDENGVSSLIFSTNVVS